MFCAKCGKEINDEAVVCVHCGCATGKSVQANGQKQWLVALLLVLFLGPLGAHRFYTGHIATGIIQLLTFGGCAIWAIIDLICIILGVFKAADGSELAK